MTDNPLFIDFASGAVAHRRVFGGGRGQALPKAVGLTKGRNPHVVDATAGLGRDSFLLASLGATVTMIERSAHVHAALADALARAAADDELAEIAARMTLIHGDARAVLADLSPQVVLVDPMHPERTKSALVKKEMRVLRELVGTDPDSVELMRAALDAASDRVVLKWPLRAAPMEAIRKPSHQVLGKTTRYDVFVNAAENRRESTL